MRVPLCKAGLLVVLIAGALSPRAAFAQSAIAGVVRDPSGAVLPGVVVEASSPVLIEKVRTAMTDTAGAYRLIDLRPGVYTVTFTLAGFNTFRRDGFELSADFTAPFTLRLDPLAAVMILVITGIGSLIHLYSTAYMHEERDSEFARYFSYLNLFAAFMLVLVLGSNFLAMFVGWEGVGLCSYLLIGFWYAKKSATDAGKKAFIVNRIGDVGFVLGMLFGFSRFGTLDFEEVAGIVGSLAPETAFLTSSSCGSSGKFATFRRSSRNGSRVTSTRSFALSTTLSPISTSRSASQSPKPFLSSTDIATSMFVLNCTRRSRMSATGPALMPSNFTPKRCSYVFARPTM